MPLLFVLVLGGDKMADAVGEGFVGGEMFGDVLEGGGPGRYHGGVRDRRGGCWLK